MAEPPLRFWDANTVDELMEIVRSETIHPEFFRPPAQSYWGRMSAAVYRVKENQRKHWPRTTLDAIAHYEADGHSRLNKSLCDGTPSDDALELLGAFRRREAVLGAAVIVLRGGRKDETEAPVNRLRSCTTSPVIAIEFSNGKQGQPLFVPEERPLFRILLPKGLPVVAGKPTEYELVLMPRQEFEVVSRANYGNIIEVRAVLPA